MSLTQKRLIELFDYNSNTGIFTCKVRTGGTSRIGGVAGGVNARGYVEMRVDGRTMKAHRLAWLYVYGELPTFLIDHINGQKSDNRICNLRHVLPDVNQQNQRAAKGNNKSGLLGVSIRKKGGFEAGIRVGGKRHYLGLHWTAESAHAAYVEAKRKLHEGCTI